MEERRLILVILSISLAALAANEEDPTPNPPSSESSRIPARAAPPPPPPRPPPKPSLPNNTLIHPQVLGEGQCDVGAVNSSIFNASRYADAGRLYVDFGQPAQCSGEVIKWEFCYIALMVQSGPGSQSSSSDQNMITAVVLRRDTTGTQGSYGIINVYDIDIDGARGSSEGYITACIRNSIDSEDAMFMERGDLLGFICGERVRMIFTSSESLFQSQHGSGLGGMIRVLNISSMQQDISGGDRASYLMGMNPIQEDRFELINGSVTPLLRVIMKVANDSSTTSELPTTIHPTTTPCSLGDEGDIFRNTIFIVVLAIASAIILILLVLVFILSCCLCKMKFWCCYKLHSCCSGLFLSCHRKNQVVHTIKVEPMSVGLEQSMQYNELYVPSTPRPNQRNRMSQCRGELHRNPAYSPDDAPKANGIDETGRAADSSISEATRGLEHTYEMIDTIR